MADYAYKDEKRTQIIYANSKNIIAYKGIPCYCKNSKCNSKMYIVTPEYPDKAYFRASPNTPHTGSCGSELHHFDRGEFNPNLFKFPDILVNLENESSNKEYQFNNHSGKVGNADKAIKTLRQLYSMCTNTPISDEYAGIRIGDIIADSRNVEESLNGISGRKIIECNFYKYDKDAMAIYFNYPCFPDNKALIQASFQSEEKLKNALNSIIPLSHSGIIVISANWNVSNDEKIICEGMIHSQNQIAIVKKD